MSTSSFEWDEVKATENFGEARRIVCDGPKRFC